MSERQPKIRGRGSRINQRYQVDMSLTPSKKDGVRAPDPHKLLEEIRGLSETSNGQETVFNPHMPWERKRSKRRRH